jgi:hypothetical protein
MAIVEVQEKIGIDGKYFGRGQLIMDGARCLYF